MPSGCVDASQSEQFLESFCFLSALLFTPLTFGLTDKITPTPMLTSILVYLTWLCHCKQFSHNKVPFLPPTKLSAQTLDLWGVRGVWHQDVDSRLFEWGFHGSGFFLHVLRLLNWI